MASPGSVGVWKKSEKYPRRLQQRCSGSQKTLVNDPLVMASRRALIGWAASVLTACTIPTRLLQLGKNAWVPFTLFLKHSHPNDKVWSSLLKWHCKTIELHDCPRARENALRRVSSHTLLFLAMCVSFLRTSTLFLSSLSFTNVVVSLDTSVVVKNGPHQNIFLNWTSQRWLQRSLAIKFHVVSRSSFHSLKKKKIRMG